MTSQSQIEWKIVMETEVFYRQRCHEAVARGEDSKIVSEYLREWWGAVAKVMQTYARHSLSDELIFPTSLARALEGLVGHLAIGDIPGPIRDAAVEGRTGLKPGEKRDIGLAVAYLMACNKDGLMHNKQVIRISDIHPTKTVAALYQVREATVRKWRRQVEAAFLGVNDIDSEIVEYHMREAAKRYLLGSRSSSAIERRGRPKA